MNKCMGFYGLAVSVFGDGANHCGAVLASLGPVPMEIIFRPFVETAKDPLESADYLAPG